MEENPDQPKGVTICDLPDEILEYIFSLLSPYRDYRNAMLVCQRWHCIVKDVASQEYSRFREALADGCLSWTAHPPAPGPTITERYSQSACYLNKCLYVFGGCTSKNTTFNDLWKFDLGSGEWIRPLAMGTYPSPKAYASLVSHRGRLVLFGGWSHPTPLSLHQPARFFQQLHTYTPETNTWEEIVTTHSPLGLAGHGACVVGDSMVVFGGSKRNGVSCNDIWVLNLRENEWTLRTVSGNKPLPRYGHAQVVLDDLHIVIAGGCGGPVMLYSDVWLLTMDPEGWTWEEITVLQPQNCAPQLWCHPSCKVGDKLLVLSKITKTPGSQSSPTYNPQFRTPKTVNAQEHQTSVNPRSKNPSESAQTHCCCCQQVTSMDKMSLRAKRSHPETSESSSQESSSDNDEAANPRLHSRGKAFMPRPMFRKPLLPSSETRALKVKDDDPEPSTSKMSPPTESTSPPSNLGGRPGQPSIRPNAMRNRQKQLEMLKRYEERIKGQRAKESKPVPHAGSCCHGAGGPCKLLFPANKRRTQHPLYLHTMDLSKVLTNRTVTWLPLSSHGVENAPEETIFYSLVEGRGELIMFGGIQTDMNNMRRHPQHSEMFSNNVYFLSSKKVLR